MKVWKLAILEDNQELLDDRKRNLEKIDNVKVVASAANSVDFLQQIRETKENKLILLS